MSDDLAGAGPWGNLDLLERLRTTGPYEEWLARPHFEARLPSLIALRRPHPARTDGAELSHRLTHGAQRAKAVEHHLVRHCFGVLEREAASGDQTIAQLLEDLEGVDLERLLQAEGPLSPHAALTLVARAADAIAHAHALEIAHGALAPAQIFVQRDGQIRIDFALAASPRAGSLTEVIDPRYGDPRSSSAVRTDLQALVTILRELLTGSTEGSLAHVHVSLARIIERGSADAREPFETVRALGDAVLRALYRDVDEAERGQSALGEHVARAFPRNDDPHRRYDRDTATEAKPNAVSGRLTQALKEREAPVHPRDLTTGDYEAEAPWRTDPRSAYRREASTEASDPPHVPEASPRRSVIALAWLAIVFFVLGMLLLFLDP